jgi:hypothetical protein
MTTVPPLEIQIWHIDRLTLYARNPRKNDAVVDRIQRFSSSAESGGGPAQRRPLQALPVRCPAVSRQVIP